MRLPVFFLLLPVLAAQPGLTAIRGARVVDGTGAAAREATVLLRGGRIEAVAPNLPIPASARVIDAAGQTLLPGLFDLHTHLRASAVSGVPADWGKNLKSYLACGVTSVDDFSVYGEMFAPIRRLLSSGTVVGPRVNLAYRISTPAGHGTEGGWGDAFTLLAATPAQAHAAMRRILPYRPEVIKVFTDGWRYGGAPDLTGMNVETLSAIVEDAHAARIKVLTHTVTLNGAKIAARAGVDVIAHGIGDAAADSELIDLLKAHHTAYASTLAVYERHPAPPGARSSRLSLSAEARDRRWRYLLDNLHCLFAAGIAIASGTDAGMPGTFHGRAALRELELMVEAGMPPIAAITAATSGSARALGIDDRGVIAPGKLADLLLIDGRPDQRIEEIEKTARVFLGGREFDPQKLQAEIASAEATVLPAREIQAELDDMEDPQRTRLGTLRVNSSDDGTDHSEIFFLPVIRKGRDHALMVQARLAAKEQPFVRVEFPLTEGGIEPADLSRFTGLSFEARGGPGDFRLEIGREAAPFYPTGAWQTIRIPFATHAASSIQFRLSGESQQQLWLELDNLRFY